MVMSKRAVEETVEEFFPDFTRQRDLAIELDKWVDVKNETPSMPRDRFTKEYATLQEVSKTPWARLIVTEVAQSLFVDGYRHSSESENSPAWDRIWQPNGNDARQIAVHRGALNHGLSYVLSLPGEGPDGKEMSVTRGVSAKKGIALYRDDPLDPEDEWPLLFLHVDQVRIPGAHGPVYRIRYVDEEHIYTVDYDPEDTARFTYVSHSAHGTGVVPVIRFANMLDLDGESMGEIEPVLPLLRRIDQDAFDRLIIQRYQSWQIRTATGMEKPKNEAEAQAMAMKMRVNDLLMAENPEARFGTLPATSMTGLIDARDSDIRDLAAVTQTPPHHLLGLSPNVSAEGLVEAQASLMRKIEERKESFGDSWERVIRLAAHQMGMKKEAEDFSAEIRWRDTESRSLNQVADALGKMAKLLGVPVQMLWERIPDWTDQDTKRAMELLQDDSSEQELLRRLTAGATMGDLVAEGQVSTGAAETTTPGSTGVLGDPDSPERKAANRKRGGYGPDWDGDGKQG